MLALLFFILANEPLLDGKRFHFEMQESWVHDRFFGGSLFGSVIDDDGDLIAQFQRDTTFIANKRHIADFRPVGEGPADLDSCFGATLYGPKKVAIMGFMGRKIKIFQKENGVYEWEETIHRRAIRNAHAVEDLVFYEDKWFIGGASVWPKEGNPKEFVNYHILVLQKDGTLLKRLLKTELEENLASRWMRYYLSGHKDKLYFMAEHDLRVHVVSPTELKILESPRLKPPLFYKPMPDDAYREKTLNPEAFEPTLSKWHTSYSSVTNIALAQGHLIVQLRTATPGKPRFALMFYDLERFELADMLFANDQLVAYKDDLFYFYKDGMPYDDDDAGPFHIDIRRLVAKDRQ